MKLSERIKKAFEKNPLYDLALQLFNEGYDSVTFLEAVKKAKEKGEIINEVAMNKVWSHLRDICRWHKESRKGNEKTKSNCCFNKRKTHPLSE